MNKIIVMFEEEDKELKMSLYDFVDEQYGHSNPIMVCHVTEEEYKIMLKQIKQEGQLRERSARIMEEGYDRYRYLLAYNPARDNISIANYEDFDQKGNYTLDSEGLHYSENGIQFPRDFAFRYGRGIRIYTTETYKDVIEYYSSKPKQISLSSKDIKRFEDAYKSLSKSLDPKDYTESNLTEFRILFAKIMDKCDQ